MVHTEMLQLNWNDMSDIKHALYQSKVKMYKNGFHEDACHLHGLFTIVERIMLEHTNDPDDITNNNTITRPNTLEDGGK